MEAGLLRAGFVSLGEGDRTEDGLPSRESLSVSLAIKESIENEFGFFAVLTAAGIIVADYDSTQMLS